MGVSMEKTKGPKRMEIWNLFMNIITKMAMKDNNLIPVALVCMPGEFDTKGMYIRPTDDIAVLWGDGLNNDQKTELLGRMFMQYEQKEAVTLRDEPVNDPITG